MTTHSQISLECQPPVAISDPQPDTTPLNHLPGGSSTVTPNSSQTQEGVSSYPSGKSTKSTGSLANDAVVGTVGCWAPAPLGGTPFFDLVFT